MGTGACDVGAPEASIDFDAIDDPAVHGLRGSIEQLRSAIRDMAWSGRDAARRHGYLPAATSAAMRSLSFEAEFAGAWGDEPIQGLHTHMGMLRLLADDCILAVTSLLTFTHPPIYACHVLTRTTLEATGRLRWLAAPGLAVRQRVARFQTERLYSATEIARLDNPNVGMDPAETRRNIFETAELLGFRKLTKKGTPPAIDEPRPSATTLVRSALEELSVGHLLMNYLSGVTHGTLYALLQAIDREELEPLDPPGPVLAPVVLSSQAYRTLLIVMATAYRSAVGSLVGYFGWRDDVWIEIDGVVRDQIIAAARSLAAERRTEAGEA